MSRDDLHLVTNDEIDRLVGINDPAVSWLPDDFVIEGESPPVGSYTVGVPGRGFVLVDKLTGDVTSFDSHGDQIAEELLGLDAKSLAERLGLTAGADVPHPLAEAVVEPAKDQEEALESTALRKRVVFKVPSGPGAYARLRHLLSLPGRVEDDDAFQPQGE